MMSLSNYNIGIRITSLVLVLVFLFSPIVPFFTHDKAYALNPACEIPSVSQLLKVPVTDSASTSSCDKETVFGWDSLGQAILKGILSMLINSMTTWVNSGFNGSPVFVDDLKLYLEDVKNIVAVEFLSQLLGADACTFFGDLRVLFGTRPGIVEGFKAEARCTLDDIGIDAERFFDDFSAGGWYAYEQSVTGNNNVFALYINGQDALNKAQDEEVERKNSLLSWANGFLDFKDANGKTTTPGAIISARLGTAVGTDLRQYELADEFDELFAALINQLVGTLFAQLR